jgi:hypothetical protein
VCTLVAVLEQVADRHATAMAGGFKVLSLRGTLRGRMALGGAGLGLPTLASASVLPGQELYLGRGNRSSVHGKEKVYRSIP